MTYTQSTNHSEAQTSNRSVSNGVETRHTTVLLKEAVESLRITPGDVVVDATVGGAGHFRALLDALDGQGTLIGIDADASALARAKEASAHSLAQVRLIEGNFRDLGEHLDSAGVEEIDAALFDLGWSAFHLSSGRGFSFMTDEPLLMTYGEPVAGNTAADLVNGASEEALADLFYSLGEERFARAIARGIANARRTARILTTAQLADIVSESVPAWYRGRRLHPATKTFQALRIAVNDELGALRDGLSTALARLAPGGRVAVISFHSIEDRIVKQMLRDVAHEGKGVVVTKKPVTPGSEELTRNPRARSAKLRVFERSDAPVSQTLHTPAYTYAPLDNRSRVASSNRAANEIHMTSAEVVTHYPTGYA